MAVIYKKKTKQTSKQAQKNFLSNANLLIQIEQSKLSYCSYLHDEDALYDAHADDLSEIAEPHEGMLVRLFSYEHIPDNMDQNARSGRANHWREPVPFRPFSHYRYQDGEWTECLRSHWQGSLHNGEFSAEHGQLTNDLAKSMMLFVKKYGSKYNWNGYSYREDMEFEALAHLCGYCLKFDESRTSNPFSFMTTSVYNVFLRVLRDEKSSRASAMRS